MRSLVILTSFLDQPFVAGYSLRSIFEYWWLGLIVIGAGAVGIGTTYALKAHVFGKSKFTGGEDEILRDYKSASRKEKKLMKKEMSKPLKNVIGWKGMAPWFIPTVVVSSLILGAAAAFLPSNAFKNLLTTMKGSEVTIYDTPTSRAIAKEAEKNVIAIEEEGLVLLKNENDALPIKLEENANINIFGSCAFGLYYGNGGSGSFQTDGRYGKEFERIATKLEVAMKEQGFNYNTNIHNMIKNYYSNTRNRVISVAESDYDIQCGYNKYGYKEIVASCDPTENEPPVSVYNTPFDDLGGQTLLENALDFSDTALFCISRRGSEDEDMNYSDLILKQNEKDCIEMLKANFDKVIILLNVPTVIEADFLNDPAIDAAIFIGHPGLTGSVAVAEALCGVINPSGRLVDTWPYSVKSAPSYQNFGNETTLQHTGLPLGSRETANFTEYLEGIYVGYRYYVTRAMEDPQFDYDSYVQYSFGYGLSYTTFDKSICEYNIDEEKQEVLIGVEVKNTGPAKGKDVIEIYTHAPYYSGGIEKSYYSLSTFLKTNEIEPGDSKNYQLKFTFRDIASWSDSGFYVLEHGNYEFSLRENVWDLAETSTGRNNIISYNLSNDVEFRNSYQTGKQYENIFAEVERGPGNEPIEYLSRNDFEGTWKNTADIDKAALEQYFPGGVSNQTSGRNWNFTDNQINEPLPTTGADNGMNFMEFKDAEWDDSRWDDLLDQLSVKDMQTLVDGGSFATPAIKSINKPASRDYDGPSAAFHSGTGHPSEVILACTWSIDMAHMMGASIGREGAARGLTGWYAPGINTHRSPFGGRNFEYYSEDPLISGLMAGYTAQGAKEYGVYCYAKHFMCNEQENSRAGVFVWAKEQALREIYARGFELYVDLGGIGIMSSFNSVGSWWAGASYPLLTTLLREEWGFHGVVVTDYAGPDYMATNIGLRAGNDLWLNTASISASNTYSATPNDATILLRKAAKNILYACANSNNIWTDEDYAAVGIPEVIKATDRS